MSLTFTCGICEDSGPLKKLGRGLSNSITGVLEIPFSIRENSEEHGYMAGGLYGIPVGIGRAAMRTLVGIYETVTFALPFPENYEPILEPQFSEKSPFEKMR